jgi:hypothetical protein
MRKTGSVKRQVPSDNNTLIAPSETYRSQLTSYVLLLADEIYSSDKEQCVAGDARR